MKLIASNHKARYNYFLSDFHECGISLLGSEIKSLRAGRCSIDDSYVSIKDGECFIINMNIPLYQGNKQLFSHEETRTRKLLLHKKEILSLFEAVKRDGYTLVPTKVYLEHGLCKVEIALGKGKKNYDKREVIKNRDIDRNLAKIKKGKWVY